MHRLLRDPRHRAIAILVAVVAFLVLASAAVKVVLYIRPTAPKLAPMTHFKTQRDGGCFGLALDHCRTSYYYVAEGDLTTVVNQVYETLSQNDNYSIDRDDERTLHIKYKNVDPNRVDTTKTGFFVSFVAAPKPSDDYWGFFIPTDTCHVGSTNCVEALIVRTPK
jgi:hypothetical protein